MSSAQRNQFLGWAASDTFGRHYISSVSSVDGQAAFLKEDQRSTHINLLRSAVRARNCGAPRRLSAQANFELSQTSEMLAIDEELATLPTSDTKEKRRLYAERQRLRAQALAKSYAQYLKDDYQATVSMPSQIEPESEHYKVGIDVSRSDQDFVILRPFIPERARIADLADEVLPPGGAQQRLAYEDLASLCDSGNHRVLYRPNKAPIAGHCPIGDYPVILEK